MPSASSKSRPSYAVAPKSVPSQQNGHQPDPTPPQSDSRKSLAAAAAEKNAGL